jgi:hypothetical protein
MAKDFNVYQWRRQHLNEEHSNVSLKKAMEEWFGGTTPTKEEMINFVEWFYNQDPSEKNMMGLNESNVVVKKIKDITWDDVNGLALPTKSAGMLAVMKTTNNLDSWKKQWDNNEAEMDITIDRTATPWFNQVKINDASYNEKMGAKNKAVQADYDTLGYKGD